MLAEDIVMCTGTAAFSRGPDGTITAWNEAAERLIAVPADEVVGRRCHEVIQGRDVFGNDFCGESCTCWRMAVADRRIHPYRLIVKDVSGRALGLRVSILPARGSIGPELVHLLETVMDGGAFEVFSAEFDNGVARQGYGRSGLTERELEVLRHLALGFGTRETARRLLISTTTVRNHISRCLHKLNAHSRVEAVAAGRRLDLV